MLPVEAETLAAFLKRDLDRSTAELLLAGATELVTEYCEWHISPSVTETITVDGNGLAILPLPTLSLSDVTDVSEAGRAVPASNYTWSSIGLLEKTRGGPWVTHQRGIGATITHGFGQTPRWVTTLICAVAGRAYMTMPGIYSQVAGEDQVGYAGPTGSLPPGTVSLLDVDKRMLDRIAIPRRP